MVGGVGTFVVVIVVVVLFEVVGVVVGCQFIVLNCAILFSVSERKMSSIG